MLSDNFRVARNDSPVYQKTILTKVSAVSENAIHCFGIEARTRKRLKFSSSVLPAFYEIEKNLLY